MLNGILNLNKPAGLNSTSAVGRIKRLLPRGIKVGHAGTLDNFASGVLLILVGRATKMCEQLMASPKQYVATLRLGATSETGDPDSPDTPTPDARPATREQLLDAIAPQIGLIQQVPPVYSALKVGGRRASDRIRSGETVTLQPRTVRIDAIDLLDYAWPAATIRVDCGRGTYIRSLARDIGQTLGVGGYVTALERTRVGDFWIAQAAPLDALTPDTIADRLTPISPAPT